MIDVSELNLQDAHEYLKEIISGNKEIRKLLEDTNDILRKLKTDDFDRIYCTKLTKENML